MRKCLSSLPAIILLLITIQTTALGQGSPPTPPKGVTDDLINAKKSDVRLLLLKIDSLEKAVKHDPKLKAELDTAKAEAAKAKTDLATLEKAYKTAQAEALTNKMAADKAIAAKATADATAAKAIADATAAKKLLAAVKPQVDLPRDFTGWVKLKKGDKAYAGVKLQVPFLYEGVWHCYYDRDNALYYIVDLKTNTYERK